MKLRIRGNSLRLRLTQGEVAVLAERGVVEETTTFGAGTLTYALAANLPAGAPLAATLAATQTQTRVEVRIASDVAKAWSASDDVGLEGTDGALRILVEKDFACVQPRPHEDDTDAFPNPQKTC